MVDVNYILSDYSNIVSLALSLSGMVMFALFARLAAHQLGPFSVITIGCALVAAAWPAAGLWLFLR
jgi:hypothetical protein